VSFDPVVLTVKALVVSTGRTDIRPMALSERYCQL
jgi:hypothetical protein